MVRRDTFEYSITCIYWRPCRWCYLFTHPSAIAGTANVTWHPWSCRDVYWVSIIELVEHNKFKLKKKIDDVHIFDKAGTVRCIYAKKYEVTGDCMKPIEKTSRPHGVDDLFFYCW